MKKTLIRLLLTSVVLFFLGNNLRGQFVMDFTHSYYTGGSLINWEQPLISEYNYQVYETNSLGAQSGANDGLRLTFPDTYIFQENSVTSGWSSVDIASFGNTTRSYYYSGLDEALGDPPFEFSMNSFNLNFTLLTNDSAQVSDPVSVIFNYTVFTPELSASGGIGGPLTPSPILYSGVIPEPSTYALILGSLSMLAFLLKNKLSEKFRNRNETV